MIIETNKIIAEFMNKEDSQINSKRNGIEWYNKRSHE